MGRQQERHARRTTPTTTTVWHVLNALGRDQLQALRNEMEELAHAPGELVLVQAQQMREPSAPFESLLLSALDIRTHLQVARIYFFSSLAATIDFVEFIAKSYPFPVQEIATLGHHHLGNEHGPRMEHRFTLAAHRCGVRHRPAEVDQPGILLYLERYCRPLRTEILGDSSPEGRSAELQRYLFYHNNQRSLPTLQGRTPLEELKRFPQFKNLSSFDPLI